jgi:cytoskeletal protein CcmA (bactofilin family)
MATQAKESERTGGTVIGETLSVTGNVEGDEDLTVRGRVEGRISITRALVVEATGVLKAECAAKTALVSGVVVGNITATERVELTREARVVGDLCAPKIVVAEGAALRGQVAMGEEEKARAADRAPKSQAAPASAAKGLRPVPAQAKPAAGPPAKALVAAKPEASRAPVAGPSIVRPAQAAAAAGGSAGGPVTLPKPPPAAPPAPPVPVGIGKRKVIVKQKK